MTTATISTHLLSKLASSRSISRISSFSQNSTRAILLSPKRIAQRSAARVHCAAVETAASDAKTKKNKSTYELQTLTTWLLKQEQQGIIDAELTIVLSSISMACKQIASLVQRAGISNLTGVQGAVNVQGEDQKKLDVVSNEVRSLNILLS